MIRYQLIGLLLAASCTFASGPLTRLPWGQQDWVGSTASQGRGGTGVAIPDSSRLNELNPALFHTGRLTRFQIAFTGTQSRVSNGSASETLSSGAFGSWAIGFPLLWHDISAGLRLRPRTSMDFLTAVSTEDDLGHSFTESLKGEGGLSEASLLFNAALPLQGLRAGLELNLVFGSMVEEWKLFYPESAPPYDSWITRRQGLLGFQPKIGLAWNIGRFNSGLTWAPATDADLTVDLENTANNVDREVENGKTQLPGELTLGLSWKLGEYLLASDLRLGDWSGTDLGSAERNQARVDAPLGFALGAELPMSRDYMAPWFRRMTWRGGVRYQESYVDMILADGSSEGLQTTTFSFGAGIPLKQRHTWLDLAVEWEMRGDNSTMGLEDQSLRVRAGLSARDLWFVRPRY